MKIERLPNRAYVAQARYMAIEGERFQIPSDFEQMIEDLCDADGVGSAVAMYDDRIKAIFEKAGLISRTVRGSYSGTAKLKKFRTAILDAYYEEVPDAKLPRG